MAWSETTYTPAWSDEDTEAALGWAHDRAQTCTGCGHQLDESTDDRYRAAWITERVTCWACAATQRTQRGDTKDGNQPAPGTKYVTRNRARDLPEGPRSAGP